MKQYRTFGDKRELMFCAYCAGDTGTKDHVPSRVLLDKPYPENLPVVPCCRNCNEGFSTDEEYLACLIDSVLAGAAAPDSVGRPKVRSILARKPALAARLEQAISVSNGNTHFSVETARIENVIRKLGAGHSLFELHSPQHERPNSAFTPIPLLSGQELAAFEDPPTPELFPEVGSRALVDMASRGSFVPEWVVVQPGRYRYLASAGPPVTVRMVLSEYLACEVNWAG